MIVIDANILLYAYDTQSQHHGPAKAWLEQALAGEEQVGLGLQAILAFIRIGTSAEVYERPLASADAIAIVASWLALPGVVIAEPGDRHWTILSKVAAGGQARGSRLMDAHLAALAMEHSATLATTDRGFARFPGLRFRNPL